LPPNDDVRLCAVFVRSEGEDSVGAGISNGLVTRRIAVPAKPTREERSRPEDVRSRRYQRSGFARERVTESWRVVSHGRRRCCS